LQAKLSRGYHQGTVEYFYTFDFTSADRNFASAHDLENVGASGEEGEALNNVSLFGDDLCGFKAMSNSSIGIDYGSGDRFGRLSLSPLIKRRPEIKTRAIDLVAHVASCNDCLSTDGITFQSENLSNA